jgi:Kelch motif
MPRCLCWLSKILHHPTDVFQDPQSTLPCRLRPSIVLFGPEDHRRLLVFGGKNEDGDFTADFFCLDLLKLMWSKFVVEGGSICPRWDASTVVFQNKLYIFGGSGKENLHTYSVAEFSSSLNTWTWQIIDKPLGGDLSSSRLMAVPLYGGRKILIIASVRKGKAHVRNVHSHISMIIELEYSIYAKAS